MLRIVSPPRVASPPAPVARTPAFSIRSTGKRNNRAVILALFALDAIFALLLVFTGGKPGVQTFATIFLGIFIEAMPFVLLGALVSGVIGVFVRDEAVARLLPRGRVAAPVVGSLLGLLFPVCECGVVPVTRRLVNKGASVGLGIAFLFASPVINPIVLWSTYAAFGGNWHMVAWRAGLTFAIASFVGFVFACHPDGRALLKPAPISLGYHTLPTGAGSVDGPHDHLHHEHDSHAGHDHAAAPLAEKLRHVCEHSAMEFFEMGKFLVFGAILAFLVFGPMVDIKSTLMFLTVFKARAVALMVALAALLVLLATIVINMNIA